MVSFSTLFTPLLAFPTVFATLLCHNLDSHITINPPLADCQHIAARIPSLTPPFKAKRSPALRPRNSPFMPRAQFRHGNCMIQLSLNSGPLPATRGELLASRRCPSAALSEDTLFRVWTLFKRAAEAINEECVANRRSGTAWSRITFPELADAWVLIETASVTHPPAALGKEWTARARLFAEHALWGDPRRYHHGQGFLAEPNKYSVSFFGFS